MKRWCSVCVLCLGLAACASDGARMADRSFNPDNSIACRLAATERELPPVYDKQGRSITLISPNRYACTEQVWSWYRQHQHDVQDEPIDYRRKEGD